MRFILLLTLFISVSVLASDRPEHLSISQWSRLDSGEILSREIEEPRKGQTFEAMGIVPGKPEKALAALLSFADYPKFMPNVENTAVIQHSGNHIVIEQTLGLPLGQIRKYRLDNQIEKKEDSIKLSWKMIQFSGIPENQRIGDTQGYWLLLPHKDKQTLAIYHNYSDPGHVPFGMGWIVEYLSGRSIKDILLNTRQYIQQHQQELSQ